MFDRGQPVFAPEAGGLVAAERKLDRGDVVLVDPARPRLQPRDHAMRARDVGGEDPGGQPEFGRIGAGHHLVLIVERQHRHDRAEHLVAHDRGAVVLRDEDRRRDEPAARQIAIGQPLATRQQPHALPPRALDMAEHDVHLRLGHQRADLRGGIKRIADDQARGACRQALQKVVQHRSVDEDAGAVRADLTSGIEVGEHRAGHRIVERGILEHDQRRLAAQFQRHRLQPGRGRRHHRPPRRHRSGQRDLGDVLMGDERAAERAVALHDLEYAIRQPGVAEHRLERRRGQRGLFGGLEDHRIAARQRRRRLPAGDLQRIIPCADAGDDAQRLAPGIAERFRAQIQMLPRHRGGDTRIIFQAIGTRQDVDRLRLLHGFARVERFDPRQFDVALAQDVRGAAQDAAALARRQCRPCRLRGAGAGDGRLQRGRVRHRDARQRLSRRGIARHDLTPRRRGSRHGGEAAVDERSQQMTRAVAVNLAPSRQRAAQPYAIDHRRDRRRERGRFLGRHQRAERMAQVGQHAALIDVLDAEQARLVPDVSPKGQPDLAGRAVELFGREVRVDHCLQTLARPLRLRETQAQPCAEPRQQQAERRLEQPLLVAEIMRHQSRRHARAPRDLDQRRADEPHFGQAVDRHFDELSGAAIVSDRRGTGHKQRVLIRRSMLGRRSDRRAVIRPMCRHSQCVPALNGQSMLV